MECYYRKNNNRMYRNHSTQMGCRGMRSGSNINDSCMKDEKKSCDKMEKICNFIKEEKNCGCNRTGNMRRENSCECGRVENIRMEKNCGCSRMGNTKLENNCGRMGRSGNNCDCNKMEHGCPKKETCGCEKKIVIVKRKKMIPIIAAAIEKKKTVIRQKITAIHAKKTSGKIVQLVWDMFHGNVFGC